MPMSNCLACGGSTSGVLSLGDVPLARFPRIFWPEAVPAAPLDLVICNQCELVQLAQIVDRHELFAEAYGYRSGTNEAMRAELCDVADSAIHHIGELHPEDWILDIGANRSEEHTSELQSRLHLVCRLLLEKKKTQKQKVTKLKQHVSAPD